MQIDIGGTHIHYFLYCKRKLWMCVRHINMEQTSEIVTLGKLIEESTYDRRSEKNKQILLGSIKVDYLDKKKKILYETKKSSKNLDVSIWQMKYYLYVVGDDWSGVIEIPSEKKRECIQLNNDDIDQINGMIDNINIIINGGCPEKESEQKCKKCSYYYLCYS